MSDHDHLIFICYHLRTQLALGLFGLICAIQTRPRNRSSRPLTIDPRQMSINSIDRLDFWPCSWLSASAIDSIDLTDFILYVLYLPRFLADRTNSGGYATAVLRRLSSSSPVNCG